MMNMTTNPISLLMIPVFVYLLWIGGKDVWRMCKEYWMLRNK